MRTFLVSILIALALAGVLACGPSDTSDPSAAPEPAADAGAGSAAGPEVTYEPAYPEDVSSEGLTTADVDQQEIHAHDGEAHTHEDGEHTHGDGNTHDDHDL